MWSFTGTRISYSIADGLITRELSVLIITSPARAVAKYYDDYVCLSVRDDISGPHARSLPNFWCMLPMSVARFSSAMLTIGRIACRREGGDRRAQRG